MLGAGVAEIHVKYLTDARWLGLLVQATNLRLYDKNKYERASFRRWIKIWGLNTFKISLFAFIWSKFQHIRCFPKSASPYFRISICHSVEHLSDWQYWSEHPVISHRSIWLTLSIRMSVDIINLGDITLNSKHFPIHFWGCFESLEVFNANLLEQKTRSGLESMLILFEKVSNKADFTKFYLFKEELPLLLASWLQSLGPSSHPQPGGHVQRTRNLGAA